MSLKNSKTKVEDKAPSDSESDSESTSSSDSEQEEEKVVQKESADTEEKHVSKIELEEIPRTEPKKRGSMIQKIKKIGKKKKLTPEEKLKKKQQKETIEREAAEEEFRKLLPVRIYMGIVWLAAGAVMITFLVQIVQQLIASLAQPGNTISILPEPNLPYPHVTICNWNQLVPPATSCPECELQLINCQYFGAVNPNQSDCAALWTPRLWNTQAGLFYCWEFNDDKNNILYSSTTGYAGSMAVLFGLVPLPLADPPTSRAAVQATFDLQGATTAQAIYNEISFAPAGFDSFFGLQLIETIHSEYSDMNRPDYNTSRYETAAATVKLLYPGNSTMVYAGVSFSFKTLSKQDITFTYTYTLLNFWGDFAGMIGTLMGLDVIKVSMGIPTAIFSIKAKSPLPLEDLFNG